jgi:hypothetical protein
MSDLHDRDDEMEKKLAELARIEALKGPKNPTRASQYFQPTATGPTQEEYDRLEQLKKPTVLPPRPERDFIADKRAELQRDARKERLINATGGRIA